LDFQLLKALVFIFFLSKGEKKRTPLSVLYQTSTGAVTFVLALPRSNNVTSGLAHIMTSDSLL
jgi:hypothetical protein